MSEILDFMKKNNAAYKSSEISEQTGVDKKIVDKEIKLLMKEGKVHSPKRCYYQAN